MFLWYVKLKPFKTRPSICLYNLLYSRHSSVPEPTQTSFFTERVHLFSTHSQWQQPARLKSALVKGSIWPMEPGRQDLSVLFLSTPLSDATLVQAITGMCLDYCNSFLTAWLLPLIMYSIPHTDTGFCPLKTWLGTFNSASISHHFLRNEAPNTDHPCSLNAVCAYTFPSVIFPWPYMSSPSSSQVPLSWEVPFLIPQWESTTFVYISVCSSSLMPKRFRCAKLASNQLHSHLFLKAPFFLNLMETLFSFQPCISFIFLP